MGCTDIYLKINNRHETSIFTSNRIYKPREVFKKFYDKKIFIENQCCSTANRKRGDCALIIWIQYFFVLFPLPQLQSKYIMRVLGIIRFYVVRSLSPRKKSHSRRIWPLRKRNKNLSFFRKKFKLFGMFWNARICKDIFTLFWKIIFIHNQICLSSKIILYRPFLFKENTYSLFIHDEKNLHFCSIVRLSLGGGGG